MKVCSPTVREQLPCQIKSFQLHFPPARLLHAGKALSILRQDDWVDGIGEGLTEMRVLVSQPAVEHKELVKDFRKWLESHGRSPAEQALKRRLAEIMSDGRSRR